LAIKRTRLRPCAATLIPNPAGRFKVKDLPPESEMRWGRSLAGRWERSPTLPGILLRERCAVAVPVRRRSAAKSSCARRRCGMKSASGKGVTRAGASPESDAGDSRAVPASSPGGAESLTSGVPSARQKVSASSVSIALRATSHNDLFREIQLYE